MSNKRTTLIMVTAGAIFLFLGGNNVLAKTIFVDSATCPGFGDGTKNDPFCTIRDAVEFAASGDTIDIAAGTYTENVIIDKNLTLLGETYPAPYGTIVDGGEEGSVITVNPDLAPDLAVTLSHLTITGGSSGIGGAGIFNFSASLTLINSTVTKNTAFDGGMGGSGGGGISNIAFGAQSSLTLINSTVSGNISSGDLGGGGILNFRGVVRLFNTTVAENTDDTSGGGGMMNIDGIVELTHTLIANNIVGYDCGGVDTGSSLGHNLDSDGTCSLVDTTDFSMGLPDLGPLMDNGGPTFTHALGPDSQAIDAGDLDPAGCETTDQRGVSRPMDGDEDGMAVCDIGAYELEVQPEAAPLDLFLSYQIRPSKHARDRDDHEGDDDYDDDHHGRGHEKRVVSLKDRFGKRTLRVVKPVALLNPADNGEGFNDSDTHLMSYKVEGRRNHRPRVRNIEVTNQFTEFGELFVDLVKADRLLVPASKNLAEEPLDPPDLTNINVDHFLCYRVKRSRGTPRFPRGIQVSVDDPFSEVARTFDVKGPTRLCTPVRKNRERIKNPDDHLMCYSVKQARGDEPRHQRMEGIWVKDQFGSMQVDTRKEEELCVPSTIPVSEVVDEAEQAGNHHLDPDHDDDDGKGKSKGKNKGKDKD